ncbi:MAG: GntR family transcriptional regulator [Firmicutes bacterium]|nr:GntR family transcriptional regulator [Bacillota bacterium]
MYSIVISNTLTLPIYEQVKNQIRLAIINDELAVGEMLPSIRQLAQDLRISVITTKRAYDELEAEGYITNVQGKGCFVKPKNFEFIREQKLKEIEQHFSDAISCGQLIKIGGVELHEMLEILLKESEDGKCTGN